MIILDFIKIIANKGLKYCYKSPCGSRICGNLFISYHDFSLVSAGLGIKQEDLPIKIL